MKRILSTAGWLVMAAALTMGTIACSSDDTIGEVQQPQGVKTYTMTVEATMGGDDETTRALTLDGTTLTLLTVMSDGCALGHVRQGAAFRINGKGLKMLDESDTVTATVSMDGYESKTLTATLKIIPDASLASIVSARPGV